MKLVLLPGMDGTGDLFSPLLQMLPGFQWEVIALPNSGAQDYASIIVYVKQRLPDEDFILIAESFSGPIGMALAKSGMENLKGVIFVATFLSTPSKCLVFLARCLPLKFLLKLPFSTLFIKALFLGSDASDELIHLFKTCLYSLSSALIKARLGAMYSLIYHPRDIELPVGYIQAVSDKLVCSGKLNEFRNSFNNIMVKTIEGPHFILQSKPEQCAAVISEMVPMLKKHSKLVIEN